MTADHQRRGVTVKSAKRLPPEVVRGKTVVRYQFEIALDPEAQGETGESATLKVDRDGVVVTEGRHLGSRLASPFIALDNLWGLRPFEILQLKFPVLGYGVPNVFNQISGWTLWRLTPHRTEGLFAPGWYENAAREYAIHEPDFAARAEEAMRKEMRPLTRILAYRLYKSASGLTLADRVAAKEEEYRAISESQAAIHRRLEEVKRSLGPLSQELDRIGRISPREASRPTLKDRQGALKHDLEGLQLERENLSQMERLRKALDALEPTVVPFLEQMRTHAEAMKREADGEGVDTFMAMAYAAAQRRGGEGPPGVISSEKRNTLDRVEPPSPQAGLEESPPVVFEEMPALSPSATSAPVPSTGIEERPLDEEQSQPPAVETERVSPSLNLGVLAITPEILNTNPLLEGAVGRLVQGGPSLQAVIVPVRPEEQDDLLVYLMSSPQERVVIQTVGLEEDAALNAFERKARFLGLGVAQKRIRIDGAHPVFRDFLRQLIAILAGLEEWAGQLEDAEALEKAFGTEA